VAFLASGHVDLIGFTHLKKLEFFDITTYVLDFVNKIKDCFVISGSIESLDGGGIGR